jgi:hypothetical protein
LYLNILPKKKKYKPINTENPTGMAIEMATVRGGPDSGASFLEV